jgi:multiple sugar transport system ATP-binding protein
MPDGKAQLLKEKGYVGKEVMFGVRPEDIHDEPIFLDGSPNSIVNGNIEVVENLGHEMQLYLNGIGPNPVVARLNSRTPFKDGMSVKLAFDMNKVHLFDKETEKNIFLS